jgi:hypothetical protein
MSANPSTKHTDQVAFTFDEDVSVVDSAVSSQRKAEKSRGIMAKAAGSVSACVGSCWWRRSSLFFPLQDIERHKSELTARMAAKQRAALSPKASQPVFRNAKVAPEL